MNTASAPGKIILFGEHSVVYGRPALAVPVSQVRATVDVWHSEFRGVWIEAPDIRVKAPLRELPTDHALVAALQVFFAYLGIDSYPNINIRITSTIPVASGLGSGAAVSVALIRALLGYLNRPAPDDEVNRLAYEMEKIYHGTPSGIDNTVITYARPVYFTRGKPIETFKPRKPFTIVIGDTGVAASTKQSVADLHRLWEQNRPLWESIFTQVGEIATKARHAIEFGKLRELGHLMDCNHSLLQHMTVSSPELEMLIECARDTGALGAKLSGGGRGGNMIALVNPSRGAAGVEDLRRCLLETGAKHVIATEVG